MTETSVKQTEDGFRFAKRSDLVIIAAILLLALGAFLWMRRPLPYEGKLAHVYVSNEEVGIYPLDDPEQAGEIPVPGRENVILYFDGEGAVHFHHSDCHDQLCVIYGPISRPNEAFACLPNEVVVRVTVSDPEIVETDEPDIIIG